MFAGSSRTNVDARLHRWGVILAGGDGKRLLPLTRRITGDDRPKQFCAVVGDATLLKQTRRRVSSMIDPGQTFLVLTSVHERYYRDQVVDVPQSRLLIQPQNRGTAAAILYSLMRLYALDSEALVAFFPSDHHFMNDNAFAGQIELAFSQASIHPNKVVLLGIVPDAPEVSYGWIEPGTRLENPCAGSLLQVKCFWEKPSATCASDLMRRGCLWNSFIMIGRVDSFLKVTRQTIPHLHNSFASIRQSFMTKGEADAVSALYAGIPFSSFSDDVLSASPESLAVIRGSSLGWSDLGEPARVLSVLARKEPKAEYIRHSTWENSVA